MKESISILQKIVPDIMLVLHNRYRILETIEARAPIGRRTLSEVLNQTERTLRTETDFLRKNGLLISSKAGMELTQKGRKILPIRSTARR